VQTYHDHELDQLVWLINMIRLLHLPFTPCHRASPLLQNTWVLLLATVSGAQTSPQLPASSLSLLACSRNVAPWISLYYISTNNCPWHTSYIQMCSVAQSHSEGNIYLQSSAKKCWPEYMWNAVQKCKPVVLTADPIHWTQNVVCKFEYWAATYQTSDTKTMVFVDMLSQMVHFAAVPTHVSAHEMARLYVQVIIRPHSLVREIVSDRNTCAPMISGKRSLYYLAVDCHDLLQYHPTSDGQTEHWKRCCSIVSVQCMMTGMNIYMLLRLPSRMHGRIRYATLPSSCILVNSHLQLS